MSSERSEGQDGARDADAERRAREAAAAAGASLPSDLEPPPAPLEGPDSPLHSREALAAYILRIGDRIRSAARRKLTARTRSIYDSEDVLGSVARRLDKMMFEGKLKPRNLDELWALTLAIANNTAVSYTRLRERMAILQREDGDYARHMATILRRCSNDDEAQLLLYRTARLLDDATSRQYFLLRARGASHRAIAAALDLTEETARYRWVAINRRLESLLEGKSAEDLLS
ncbi:MAG: hypothetical protein JNM94_06625 [Phycisphaerae bacterium]|nr:hypothetical protein [Phycisphaerae bacterium]